MKYQTVKRHLVPKSIFKKKNGSNNKETTVTKVILKKKKKEEWDWRESTIEEPEKWFPKLEFEEKLFKKI